MSNTAPHPANVDAVVLAAGLSRRMGQPKPLMQVNRRSFLEQAIHTLREGGCRYVVAVLNGEDDWADRLADVAGAAVVLNEDLSSEQLDSLRLGVRALPEDSAAVAVLPVDFPLVRPATVAALVHSFDKSPAPLIRPVYKGAPGHPTIFARALYDDLMHAHGAQGARDVVAAYAGEIRNIEVDDEGVIIDIDTPEDYYKHIEQP